MMIPLAGGFCRDTNVAPRVMSNRIGWHIADDAALMRVAIRKKRKQHLHAIDMTQSDDTASELVIAGDLFLQQVHGHGVHQLTGDRSIPGPCQGLDQVVAYPCRCCRIAMRSAME